MHLSFPPHVRAPARADSTPKAIFKEELEWPLNSVYLRLPKLVQSSFPDVCGSARTRPTPNGDRSGSSSRTVDPYQPQYPTKGWAYWDSLFFYHWSSYSFFLNFLYHFVRGIPPSSRKAKTSLLTTTSSNKKLWQDYLGLIKEYLCLGQKNE